MHLSTWSPDRGRDGNLSDGCRTGGWTFKGFVKDIKGWRVKWWRLNLDWRWQCCVISVVLGGWVMTHDVVCHGGDQKTWLNKIGYIQSWDADVICGMKWFGTQRLMNWWSFSNPNFFGFHMGFYGYNYGVVERVLASKLVSTAKASRRVGLKKASLLYKINHRICYIYAIRIWYVKWHALHSSNMKPSLLHICGLSLLPWSLSDFASLGLSRCLNAAVGSSAKNPVPRASWLKAFLQRWFARSSHSKYRVADMPIVLL